MKKYKFISLILIVLMFFSSVFPVYAEDKSIIHIYTVEDLIKLSKDCSLDTYSNGLTVILENDISLKNSSFLSIPSFNGTFDGNGHSIEYFELNENISPAGFISILQNNGKVKDLTIKGNILLENTGNTVGGIVGENYGTIENSTFIGTILANQYVGGMVGINTVSGTIKNCVVKGSIFGKNKIGGISGYNLGMIDSSNNYSYVNIDAFDPQVNIEEVNIDSLLDFSNFKEIDTKTSPIDIGGISGYSNGFIQNCVNYSTIGYQHIGYNIGGIAGKSSGHIYNCENNASIYGRKDVGGIVGQMEPYVSINYSESTLAKLNNQLNDLHYLVNNTINSTDKGLTSISNRLNSINDYIDDASDALSTISATGKINSSLSGSGSNQLHDDLKIDSSGFAGNHNHSINGDINASTQVTINTSLHGLSSAISGISSQMNMLNQDMNNVSNTLSKNLKSINDKVNELTNTVFDSMYSSSENIIKDVSKTDLDNVTLGKIYLCTNKGVINGDIDVAGIAGSIAIEIEMDPEEDTSNEIDDNSRKQYELRAIIQECTNNGDVYAKRSYVGNITGHMTLGFISDCYGCGDIKSDNGDYIGGIAGLSKATIQDSYARCTLSGNNYIGGIIGKGYTGEDSDTGSMVKNCFSLISILKSKQYIGAIAGVYEGNFINNTFVSDTLTAINRMNYTGIAEPITYEEILNDEKLSKLFKQLSLKFICNDEVIKEVEFEYGASFDESEFPQLETKDGYKLVWSQSNLNELKVDTIVEVIYVPYTTTLASKELRNDFQAVFLVNGSFEDKDIIELSMNYKDNSNIHLLPKNPLKAIINGIETGSLNLYMSEQWELKIPESEDQTYEIRYCPTEKLILQNDIFIKNDEQWDKIDTESFGSYECFNVNQNAINILVVTSISMIYIYAVCIVLIIGIFLLLNKKLRFTNKDNFKKIIKKIVIIIFLGFFIFSLIKGINNNKVIEAYQIIENYLNQKEQSFVIDTQFVVDNNEYTINTNVDKFSYNNNLVYSINQDNMQFYLIDDRIILENGHVLIYKNNNLNYELTLKEITSLYKQFDFDYEKYEDKDVYTLVIKDNLANKMVYSLIPEIKEEIKEINELNIILESKDNILKSIDIDIRAILHNNDEIFINSSIHTSKVKEIQLDQAVINAIELDELEYIMTKDLFDLIKAIEEFVNQNTFASNLNVDANFGPLIIYDNSKFEKSGEKYLLYKDQNTIVFENDSIYDINKNLMDQNEIDINPFALVELVYDIAINSKLVVEQLDNTMNYRLSFDSYQMDKMINNLFPKLKNEEFEIKTGEINIVLKDNQLNTIEIKCEGKIKVAITDVDASFHLIWNICK